MWNVLWSISWARLCGPEKPMIMSSSIGVEKDTHAKEGLGLPVSLKKGFSLFPWKIKQLWKWKSATNWSLWLKAPSLKKSLVIHRLLTAGCWGLNKHSQRRVDFGEDAPCFPNCGGGGGVGCASRATLGPPGYLPAGHLRGKQPSLGTMSYWGV